MDSLHDRIGDDAVCVEHVAMRGKGDAMITEGTQDNLCRCGKPLAKRKNARTCGCRQCITNNSRWHKLMWWHRNRAKSAIIPKAKTVGRIPEMDLSGNANTLNIPEIDTSDMTDTRHGGRFAK